jgi:hypothetical protein
MLLIKAAAMAIAYQDSTPTIPIFFISVSQKFCKKTLVKLYGNPETHKRKITNSPRQFMNFHKILRIQHSTVRNCPVAAVVLNVT